MAERKRVNWTDDESRKVVEAAKALAESRKIRLPLENPWGRPSLLLTLLREATVVLPEGRRRPFNGVTSVAGRVAELVIEKGIVSKEALDFDKEAEEKPLDPQEARLNQVADERDAAMQERDTARAERDAAITEIRRLKVQLDAVPSEAETLKRFFADILGRALAQSRTGMVTATPSGDILNELQRREMERRDEPRPPKHNSEMRQEPKGEAKPLVLVFAPSEMPTTLIDEWRKAVPELELREIRARADGRLPTFRLDAFGAVMIDGIRHATSAEIREAYENVPRVRQLDVVRTLQSIRDRVKGS